MATVQEMQSWMEEFSNASWNVIAYEAAVNDPNRTKALAAQVEMNRRVAQAQEQAAQALAEAAKAQKEAAMDQKKQHFR